MKPILNKWQIGASFHPDYTRMERGWKEVSVWVLNFHTLPSDGGSIGQENVRGFLFKIVLWFPFDAPLFIFSPGKTKSPKPLNLTK
jgi:hypothetical protein